MTSSTTALTVDALATAIRREHEQAEAAAMSAVDHAIRCGELLTEAKARVKHGAWLPWVEANIPFGARQAQKYMRVADRAAELRDANPKSHLTIDAALAELAEPRGLPTPGEESVPQKGGEVHEQTILDGVPIRPWPEVRDAWPLTSREEDESLAEDIRRHGVITPIQVMEDGRIIDGHRRWALSRDVCDVPSIVRRGLTDEEGKEIAYSCNVVRQHHAPATRAGLLAAEKALGDALGESEAADLEAQLRAMLVDGRWRQLPDADESSAALFGQVILWHLADRGTHEAAGFATWEDYEAAHLADVRAAMDALDEGSAG